MKLGQWTPGRCSHYHRTPSCSEETPNFQKQATKHIARSSNYVELDGAWSCGCLGTENHGNILWKFCQICQPPTADRTVFFAIVAIGCRCYCQSIPVGLPSDSTGGFRRDKLERLLLKPSDSWELSSLENARGTLKTYKTMLDKSHGYKVCAFGIGI